MTIHKILTSDGSDTLYSETYKDTYHSKHGAVQESMHIFVEEGKQRTRILEMGFGTGLNALLTYFHAEKKIHYTALELHPLDEDVWQDLNYNIDRDTYIKLHKASWEEDEAITSKFILRKIEGALQDFTPTETYNCIYFDAFAPSVQPELWTQEIFQKMFACLDAGGVLVTYSAKGEVRRRLENAGFMVERLPGPPGKREYLRAVKSS